MFFENGSLKGISGQNMSDPLKWSLTDDSRFLQAAILKKSVYSGGGAKQNLGVLKIKLDIPFLSAAPQSNILITPAPQRSLHSLQFHFQ